MNQGAGIYIITDIEADGPNPGRNSMLGFASIALRRPFEILGTFEATLEPLPDMAADPGTLAWLKSQAQAWDELTKSPKPAAKVMADYVNWLEGFEPPRTFVAHGLMFDGGWIDYYLDRFTAHRLISSPRAANPLFYQGGICLRSLAAGRLNRPMTQCNPNDYPAGWMGHIAHTHRAIDDALGYAHLFDKLSPDLDGISSDLTE